jgi:hypothetical protein
MGGFACDECLENNLPARVVPTVKFEEGGITVWRRFSWNGLGPLIILHGYLNAEGYKAILTHCILVYGRRPLQ